MAASDFRVGTRVWLPSPAHDTPFLGATCIGLQGTILRLKLDSGEEKSVDPERVDVHVANDVGLTASDHCGLIHLNEPCVCENTRLRFLDDAPPRPATLAACKHAREEVVPLRSAQGPTREDGAGRPAHALARRLGEGV